jgi:hypothetical protein
MAHCKLYMMKIKRQDAMMQSNNLKRALEPSEERRICILQYLSFCHPAKVSTEELAEHEGLSREVTAQIVSALASDGFVQLDAPQANPVHAFATLAASWPQGRQSSVYSFYVRNAPTEATGTKQACVAPGNKFISSPPSNNTGRCRVTTSTPFGGVVAPHYSIDPEEHLLYPAEICRQPNWTVGPAVPALLNLRMFGTTFASFLHVASKSGRDGASVLHYIMAPPPPGTFRVVFAIPDLDPTVSTLDIGTYVGTMTHFGESPSGRGRLENGEFFEVGTDGIARRSTGEVLPCVYLGRARGACHLLRATQLWAPPPAAS